MAAICCRPCYNLAMAKKPPMVRYWLRFSGQDLRAASTLLQAGHYRLAIFCCHLAMEKGLKAILQYQANVLPPRLHDLRMLLARTGLVPPARLRRFIDQMAGLSVPTRYPAPVTAGRLGLRRRFVERALVQSGKVLEWCRRNCA